MSENGPMYCRQRSILGQDVERERASEILDRHTRLGNVAVIFKDRGKGKDEDFVYGQCNFKCAITDDDGCVQPEEDFYKFKFFDRFETLGSNPLIQHFVINHDACILFVEEDLLARFERHPSLGQFGELYQLVSQEKD